MSEWRVCLPEFPPRLCILEMEARMDGQPAKERKMGTLRIKKVTKVGYTSFCGYTGFFASAAATGAI